MLVIDASALVGWLMPDENGIDLPALAAEHEDIVAPWLLWAELRNILGSGPITFHNQNMTVAASAMADRKTFGHLS